MRAHNPAGPAGRRRAEDFAQATAQTLQVGDHPVQIVRFTLQSFTDVRARRVAGPLDGHDVPDLAEAKPEASSLEHERQHGLGTGLVHPVAGRGAARRRQNARGFVQTDGLATDAASGCHLADQKAVASHRCMVDPAPRGKVKARVVKSQRRGRC